MRFRSNHIRRRRDGRYEVRLSDPERQLLKALPSQILDLIASGDPSSNRLFPPAYGAEGDENANAEYRQLTRESLLAHHREALTLLASTADVQDLDAEQAEEWLCALNDARLVLGTRLEVGEDAAPLVPDDPRTPGMAMYHWLTWLQDQLVDAMAAGLPTS